MKKVKVVKSRSNVATVKLSADDWVEIFYALEYKLGFSPAVQGNDREAQRWRAHLRRIIKAIGPDGKLAAASEYFDESELATVLAALRHYQGTVGEKGDAMYPDHFRMSNQKPLTLDQIDDLVERINCGE